MDLKRRDFLKGLMGLAGVAIVGLPVADEELFDDIDQFLASGGEPARPAGPYGSMRIDDKWYAVHDASVDMHQDWIDVGEMWAPQMIRGMRSWSVDCSLEDAGDVDIFSGVRHEIEVSMGGYSFSGTAYLEARNTVVLQSASVLYGLAFVGAGALAMDGVLRGA